ncbi:hypothetical protein FA13DRAFT_1789994 [Coprinellus micaceus]|uniref:Uncharacterized protein n=1 Tax=Coprinellus micaceus TaxID=71717 RepID=A0A4Y7THZ7_COPMI|nr:hypothetical protein FA13DRAFT_1789994 [Coprinellus micaceus]
MSSPSPFVSSSTPKQSGREQQCKGTCVLSGIAVCENEHYFNEKQFYKLYDGQIFVRDEAAGDGLLVALKHYDATRAIPDGDAVHAFFVAASVCKPKPNAKGIPINSGEFKLEDYDLVGDVLSAYPINDWSEGVANPHQPPYTTVSGIIEHIDETKDQITAHIDLENYVSILDGRSPLSVSVCLDLTTPRWKPNGNIRRAPYLKVGQYITATGSLIGVTRDNEGRVTRDNEGRVTALKVGTDNIVNVGLASRVLNSGAAANTPSQVDKSNVLDPATLTPSGKKFTMGRLKRVRESSDTPNPTPSAPVPASKRPRRSQVATGKNKHNEENPALEAPPASSH